MAYTSAEVLSQSRGYSLRVLYPVLPRNGSSARIRWLETKCKGVRCVPCVLAVRRETLTPGVGLRQHYRNSGRDRD
jgi:hypothetical protein